jgi:S-adenosylmethionine:tRNA ribosyltransferase-isomerase
LLVYRHGQISTGYFRDLPSYPDADAWLVFNNTRVIQARLSISGNPQGPGSRCSVWNLVDPPRLRTILRVGRQVLFWRCLVGNAKKWKTGPVYLTIPLVKGYKK